jgi:hypothetical protein
VHYSIAGVPGGVGEGDIALKVPGVHNLQNALAAVAVGLDLACLSSASPMPWPDSAAPNGDTNCGVRPPA